jgi:mannose-1-phosphate guanylyltransferase/mannose-6-phosphate isomerase
MRDTTDVSKIFLVTNEDNFFNVYNQIREMDNEFSKEQILIEPVSLNTAPAITYAVKYLVEDAGIDPEEPILMLPSDHYIGDKEKFSQVVKNASSEVGSSIGTIGITPTRPDTGFGYIKKGKRSNGFYQVEDFKEKPDAETADKYFRSGEYVWNSGIYIFNVKSFARELRKNAPDIFALLKQDFTTFVNNFHSLPEISIDRAISERSDRIVVFEGDFKWNDIGSFDRLAEIPGNRHNRSKHIGHNSKNVFTFSMNDRLITTSGVEDLIVVDNLDSILIQKKGKSEDVKNVVEHLKNCKQKELYHSLVVHESWGRYEVLIDSSELKVRRVVVYPGSGIGVHFHYHRAEHWIITRGTASIVKNGERVVLNENESTFIPALAEHSLENIGKTELEIIEVMTGRYLKEDDVLDHKRK